MSDVNKQVLEALANEVRDAVIAEIVKDNIVSVTGAVIKRAKNMDLSRIIQHHAAVKQAQQELQPQWLPIETLPVDQLLSTREMFVVRGFGIVGVSSAPYNTDAYAVWLESDCGCCYKFVRWKHNFQPTHWMPLPQGPNVVD